MKKFFLTYGDKKFNISKKHLLNLAKKSSLFDYTISLGPENLNPKFVEKFQPIFKVEKGGGYWIWKHHIIENQLNEMSKNDILIYCDAGASLNLQDSALKRFHEYIEILTSSQFGNLRMECEKQYLEQSYTFSEIFNYFEIDPFSDIGESTQLQAGHMFFKKNEHTKEFINIYKDLLDHDMYLITDKYSKNNQVKNFVSNRHDQSIFSMISKVYGSEIIENETEFSNRKHEQYDYPFLSVRRYNHGPKDKIKYFLFKKYMMNKTHYF
tara:strand:+ start:30874 stop:31674 length:801 start_codon:yes stop_codon:yes gene_type:complete